MTNETLTSRFNFSDTKDNDFAIEVSKWGFSGFYETLCCYCADNNVDLTDISDSDFDSAVCTMEQYGQSDKSTDCYYFWIDVPEGLSFLEMYTEAMEQTQGYYKGYTSGNALSLYVDDKYGINAAADSAAHDALIEVLSK